jgi:hypothetical protein
MCAAKNRQVIRPAVRPRYLNRRTLRSKKPDKQTSDYEEISKIVSGADHRKLLLELRDEARAWQGGPPGWGLKLAYYLALKYDPRFAPLSEPRPRPRHRPKIKDKDYWGSLEALAVVAHEKGCSRAKMAEAIATRRFPNDKRKLLAFKRQLENDFTTRGSRDQILSRIEGDLQRASPDGIRQRLTLLVDHWVMNEGRIVDEFVEKLSPQPCPQLTRIIRDLQRHKRNRRRRKAPPAS